MASVPWSLDNPILCFELFVLIEPSHEAPRFVLVAMFMDRLSTELV